MTNKKGLNLCSRLLRLMRIDTCIGFLVIIEVIGHGLDDMGNAIRTNILFSLFLGFASEPGRE